MSAKYICKVFYSNYSFHHLLPLRPLLELERDQDLSVYIMNEWLKMILFRSKVQARSNLKESFIKHDHYLISSCHC